MIKNILLCTTWSGDTLTWHYSSGELTVDTAYFFILQSQGQVEAASNSSTL